MTDDDIIRAIKYLQETNGYPPTFRELGDQLGMTSLNSVHYRLSKLKEQSRISYIPYRSRTLKVIW